MALILNIVAAGRECAIGSAAVPRAFAGTALLTLAACAATPPPPSAAQSDERRLFVEADESIIEYHIDQVLPDQLALDGLDRLASLDGQLAIKRTADQVILSRGDEVRRFDAPESSETVDWSVLTASALDAAREFSPAIAAVPPDKLDELVIDGALAKLDPYSRYARPEVARQRRAARDGYAGIGVTLAIDTGAVRIAEVLPDTPAASAGLLPDDRIVSVDGVPVAGLAPDDVRAHLRGAARTFVHIGYMRSGLERPIGVTVERAVILPPSVTLTEKAGIATIRLRAFNKDTAHEVADRLTEAHRDLGPRLHGIVLDLRDNPGGLLDQSVAVASLFLASGDVVSAVGRNPQSNQHFTADPEAGVEALPMAVLVNGGSASASEIVAAALQDSGRAVVIGTSSYGKGTVQTVVRTSNDGELTVTWAELVTPDGYRLNTHGVVPTLCTAGLDDTPASLGALFSGHRDPVPAALAAKRSTLDDAGWRSLRAACPAERVNRGIDILAADRLLGDPALYHRVVDDMAPSRVTASR